MHIVQGKCLVCQVPIAQGGRPLTNYVEDHFLTDDGNRVVVGRCMNCQITPQGWDEVTEAINASLSPHPIGRVVDLLTSKTCFDVMMEIQGGKCECGKEIKGGVYDGFVLRCGSCKSDVATSGNHEEPSGGQMSMKKRAQKEGLVKP